MIALLQLRAVGIMALLVPDAQVLANKGAEAVGEFASIYLFGRVFCKVTMSAQRQRQRQNVNQPRPQTPQTRPETGTAGMRSQRIRTI